MKGSDAEVVPAVMYFFTAINFMVTGLLLTPFGAYAGDLLLKIQLGLVPFCALLLFFTWRVGVRQAFIGGLTILLVSVAGDVFWIVTMWSEYSRGPNFIGASGPTDEQEAAKKVAKLLTRNNMQRAKHQNEIMGSGWTLVNVQTDGYITYQSRNRRHLKQFLYSANDLAWEGDTFKTGRKTIVDDTETDELVCSQYDYKKNTRSVFYWGSNPRFINAATGNKPSDLKALLKLVGYRNH